MEQGRSGDDFSGLRILLVEDNFLIAQGLQMMLEELRCEIVGPVPSLEEGIELARSADIHGAILDVNIVGGSCVPIAEALEARGCPFFFITGYASPALVKESLLKAPLLRKPIEMSRLKSTIAEQIAAA